MCRYNAAHLAKAGRYVNCARTPDRLCDALLMIWTIVMYNVFADHP